MLLSRQIFKSLVEDFGFRFRFNIYIRLFDVVILQRSEETEKRSNIFDYKLLSLLTFS